MVTTMRIIKQTENYTILEDVFEGIVLTFRRWHYVAEGADILFTDAFAKACGYASKADMIASTIGEQGKQEIIAMYGYLPKWVRWYEDGNIFFVGENYRVIGEA